MFNIGKTAISKKDRVLAALEGRVLDRPPCGEIAFPGNLNNSVLLKHYIYMLDTDLVIFSVDPYASDFSLTFKDPSYIKDFVRNTDCFLLGGIPGVFWPAIAEEGFEEAARLCGKYPEEFRKVIRNLKQRHMNLARELIEKGADGIMIFDDMAGPGGLFFSPKAYKSLVFPELSELIFEIKSRGKPVFFHSDGKIQDILPDLIKMGIDTIHGFERISLEEVKNIKATLAGRASFMGNITISYEECDEDKVFNTIKVFQNIFTKGNYIFSSDGSVTFNTLNNLIKIYSYFHSLWEE